MRRINVNKPGVALGKRPKKNLNLRTCEKPNCSTILSNYNNKRFCFVHRPITYPRVRGHLLKGDE